MNEALEFYADEEKVSSIHGYIYPVKAQFPETFFLRGADCWGWATWKRGWNLFETDETASDAAPTASDAFVILGRIEV